MVINVHSVLFSAFTAFLAFDWFWIPLCGIWFVLLLFRLAYYLLLGGASNE